MGNPQTRHLYAGGGTEVWSGGCLGGTRVGEGGRQMCPRSPVSLRWRAERVSYRLLLDFRINARLSPRVEVLVTLSRYIGIKLRI